MSARSIVSEVNLIDAFLEDGKTLDGAPPEFGEKLRGRGRQIWEAVWPVADSTGVVSSGQLRFLYSPASDKPYTLALIYRQQCVYRIDFVDGAICHSNPLWSEHMGAPAEVCGPHVHQWAMNRGTILANGEWGLPCRLPLPPTVSKFSHALPWLAERINLTLTSGQQSFALPEALF